MDIRKAAQSKSAPYGHVEAARNNPIPSLIVLVCTEP